MPAPETTAEEFAAAWVEAGGSPVGVARLLNTDVRNVYRRRNRMQQQGWHLPSETPNSAALYAGWHYPSRVDACLDRSVVLVCSDAHFWPGEPTPMWRAFVAVAHAIKPDAIILNGDMIDGARVSRHGRSPGYSPTLAGEVEATRANLGMLPAAPLRYWTVGNHDMRVDNFLANHAAELSDYAGSLRDRFPDWPMVWSVVINEAVEVRHRFRGGIHARWNNAMHSGVTMVTGHTHQLGVTPFEDRRGTRYGIECGMIADPMGAQFQYGEGQPSRWRPGFVALTFDGGVMRPPELCEWTPAGAIFRGQVVAEKPRHRVKAKAA